MGKLDEKMMEIINNAELKRKAGAVVNTSVINLTAESWSKYGEVIEIPTQNPALSLPFCKFWPSLMRYKVEGGIADIGIATVSYREGILPMLERHKATEITVLIDGDIIMPVAPAKDLENPEAQVNPEEVEIFYVHQKQTFTMKPGVWHWAPWSPSDKPVSMLVFLTKDTFYNDVQLSILDKIVKFNI